MLSALILSRKTMEEMETTAQTAKLRRLPKPPLPGELMFMLGHVAAIKKAQICPL